MASTPKCVACKRAYRSKLGCAFTHAVFADGKEMERKRVDFIVEGRCPDCYAPEGKHHHEGCDQERCPRCGLQMLACLEGEFGHKITGWKRTVPQRARHQRKIRIALAVDDEKRRAHIIVLAGHTHLKGSVRDWMGTADRAKVDTWIDGWRAAGIDVVIEEKTFPEMAALRESPGR